jgi:hypothetical protein
MFGVGTDCSLSPCWHLLTAVRVPGAAATASPGLQCHTTARIIRHVAPGSVSEHVLSGDHVHDLRLWLGEIRKRPRNLLSNRGDTAGHIAVAARQACSVWLERCLKSRNRGQSGANRTSLTHVSLAERGHLRRLRSLGGLRVIGMGVDHRVLDVAMAE